MNIMNTMSTGFDPVLFVNFTLKNHARM